MSEITPTETTPGDIDGASAAAVAAASGNGRRRLLILVIVVAVLLALVAAAFAWYLSTRKPLTQLPLISADIPPRYSYSVVDVAEPLGVAVDEANNRIYVTQSAGDRTVKVVDLDGNAVGVLEPPHAAGLHTPVYVAVNPTTSDVYVTDRATSTIYVYDSTGNYLREVKPVGTKGWAPLGITFDSAGNLYVTDVSEPKQKYWTIDTEDKVVSQAGADDQLRFPNGLAITDDASVILSDSNNGRVLVYDQAGKLKGALARGDADSPLGLPRGLAIDDRQRLYVVDTVNNVVRVYKPDDSGVPVYAFSFGEEGVTDGAFEFPNGIAVDARGRVYVTDRVNNRVQVWSY